MSRPPLLYLEPALARVGAGNPQGREEGAERLTKPRAASYFVFFRARYGSSDTPFARPHGFVRINSGPTYKNTASHSTILQPRWAGLIRAVPDQLLPRRQPSGAYPGFPEGRCPAARANSAPAAALLPPRLPPTPPAWSGSRCPCGRCPCQSAQRNAVGSGCRPSL